MHSSAHGKWGAALKSSQTDEANGFLPAYAGIESL